MGANAQTSVPEFTAGQVLTAQQQTEINTGIPVFATTTERDGAFGGTGEKDLAEGQFAYIEATNETQYYDGSAWQKSGPGGLVRLAGGSFSGVTTVSLPNGTFSAAYENYRFILTITALTADSTFSIRFRASGSDASGSDYITAFGAPTTASTFLYFTNNTGTSFPVGNADPGASSMAYTLAIDVINPYKTTRKYITGQHFGINDAVTVGYSMIGGGSMGLTTQYDSLTFISTTANSMTGTYSVYGYSGV
jgi:hypothetical protein